MQMDAAGMPSDSNPRRLQRAAPPESLPHHASTPTDPKNNDLKEMRDQALALLRARQRELAELHHREALTHAILDALADGVITIREDGCIESFNGAAAKLFRYTEAEMRGRDLRTLFENVTWRGGKSVLRSAQTGLWGFFAEGCELFGRRGDGSVFPMHLTMREVVLPDRRLFAGIFRDISAQKRNEASLKLAKEATEEASRTKSAFIANMSHEIRTPLTAILGYAELLLDPALTADERKAHVTTVRRSGEHLLVLVNDILDASKIEAGRIRLEARSCAPREIVDEATRLLGGRAQSKGIELTYGIAPTVPEVIVSDRTRILQILVNLLGNAVKFTAQGAVRLEAKMEPGPGGESLICFEIHDTGIGMSGEQMARLFKPFEQGDASITRQYGGTGLGLAISRRFAEMLGGSISVQSEPGRGSIFRVTLATKLHTTATVDSPPDCAAAGAAQRMVGAARSVAKGNGSAPASLAGLRVLLVDDAADNRRLIGYFLEKAGATIEHAVNGREAVEMVLSIRGETPPFDVVIMDMQMPVMDGYAAASLLRQHGQTMPIIALTGNALDGERERCIAAGCHEFITKPIDRRQLLDRVSGVVQAHRARREAVPSQSPAQPPARA